jgi:hypothetical protein
MAASTGRWRVRGASKGKNRRRGDHEHESQTAKHHGSINPSGGWYWKGSALLHGKQFVRLLEDGYAILLGSKNQVELRAGRRCCEGDQRRGTFDMVILR